MKKQSYLKNTLIESLRMAFNAIRTNKLRSSLTLLGIVIGVFSVVGVMTAIRTMESSIQSGLNVFGSNTFAFQKYPAMHMGGHGSWRKYHNRKHITFDQYKNLKRRAKLPVLVSIGDDAYGKTIRYKDKRAKNNPVIYAGDEGTVRVYNTYIEDGRNLTPEDVHFKNRVALLGGDVVDQIFSFEDPLNKTISLDGIDFQVVGITERKGAAFGESKDNYVVIPISTYLQYFSSPWTSLVITVEALSADLYDKTMDETVGIMRMLRQVPPGEDNDFETVSNEELLATFGTFTGGVKIFAFVISVIALLVAGIGIMNIMLVSVTERIKEIGIRKAIGASRKHILIQFLSESVFLCQTGGITGVFLGIVGGNLVSFIFKIPAVIPVDWVIIGLVVCSVIGIGFGSYPAWKAATLDPVDSLRHE
ncbi:MAG: ABC transporter permease [Candidatus Marinimicrobia bacterium]|jgi:putative ABC transport system permease protein|nr:ABC transporter permease [Candidatus Neomarinimicrobiota bacterium]|tara:strand:+ start:538 stop:1794 length:1257 start_codon:yes stop_codon:yes gene_type:complete